MIDDEQIARLATDLESDRVERKDSLAGSAKDRIGQAICAFANDMPDHRRSGIILVGVSDDGKPTGRPITDEVLRDLAAFRSDGNILPLPTLSVEKRTLGNADIAIVEVSPSSDPPVRYYGQVWIRVGPRRAIASRDEERILTERRRSGMLSFDARPADSAGLEDLDLDAFLHVYLPAAVAPGVIEQNLRTTVEQLAALHLATRDGLPNHAALLLLGREPRPLCLPSAYVQFERFDGTSITDPILDQKELDGPAPQLLRRIDELASINIRVGTEIAAHVQEHRLPDYPLPALQQILRNAILHRTYETSAPVHWYWFSDRIEIHSPGGPYGRVTRENFGQPYATDYRNPVLAEGLKVFGFVQKFGVGIALARKACADNRNPPPEFDVQPSAVLCTLRRRP